MLKSTIMASVIAAAATASAPEGHLYVTIGSDAVGGANKSLHSLQEIDRADGISILKVRKDDVAKLSHMMHENFNRCAGFIAHDSLSEAQEVLGANTMRQFGKSMRFMSYTIDQGETVEAMVAQTSEFSIRTVIEKLTTFHNRYYKSDTGVESQAWIKSKWEGLAKGRSDVKVEYFKHERWPQPSVIMTIEGKSLKDEVVVIGGHADSIAGWWGQARSRAPGADDNASGIATITETIRLAMENGYKPERTIKFMGVCRGRSRFVGLKRNRQIF